MAGNIWEEETTISTDSSWVPECDHVEITLDNNTHFECEHCVCNCDDCVREIVWQINEENIDSVDVEMGENEASPA